MKQSYMRDVIYVYICLYKFNIHVVKNMLTYVKIKILFFKKTRYYKRHTFFLLYLTDNFSFHQSNIKKLVRYGFKA